jgi:hypothetical protein
MEKEKDVDDTFGTEPEMLTSYIRMVTWCARRTHLARTVDAAQPVAAAAFP